MGTGITIIMATGGIGVMTGIEWAGDVQASKLAAKALMASSSGASEV